MYQFMTDFANPINAFYLSQPDSYRACLMAVRDIILTLDIGIKQEWRYGMPFFTWHGKRFCYLWVHRTYRQPYIGFVDGYRMQHPALLQEDRKRMKIMLLDQTQDLPLDTLKLLLEQAITLAKTV